MVQFDQSLDDGQTEAGAAFLAGHEGLEEPGSDALRQRRAIVGDHHPYHLRAVSRDHQDASIGGALGQGLAGIGQDVEEHGAQVDHITGYRCE